MKNLIAAVILALFAFGCGKDEVKSAPARPSSAVTTTSADATRSGDLLTDVHEFQGFEKAMRPYGVDVEEKWRGKDGALEAETRINLDDRQGDALNEQISILGQFIAKGEAVQAKYADLLQNAANASKNDLVGIAVRHARGILSVRIKLANDAILTLNRRLLDK